MEYPFKLSEIIAGCESGAWIDGAVFKNDKGNKIILKNKVIVSEYKPNIKGKWAFIGYEC